ncbi:hypothetical protein ABKV19_018844 [Rosa sericea]
MSGRHLNRRMVKLCFVLDLRDFAVADLAQIGVARRSDRPVLVDHLLRLYSHHRHQHLIQTSIKRSEELKRADAVMLMYAYDQPMTLTRISSFWLPELRRLEVLLCKFKWFA